MMITLPCTVSQCQENCLFYKSVSDESLPYTQLSVWEKTAFYKGQFAMNYCLMYNPVQVGHCLIYKSVYHWKPSCYNSVVKSNYCLSFEWVHCLKLPFMTVNFKGPLPYIQVSILRKTFFFFEGHSKRNYCLIRKIVYHLKLPFRKVNSQSHCLMYNSVSRGIMAFHIR